MRKTFIIWGALLKVASLYALNITGTPPSDPYDRFSSWTNFSVTQTPNASFWAASKDLSPIGWRVTPTDARMSVTLVTPLHAIAAHHFNPGIGTQFSFRDTLGLFHVRTITSVTQVGSTDILVVEFDTPLPAAVSVMPIWVNPYVGQPAYLYGQRAQLSNNNQVDLLFSATIGPYTSQFGGFYQNASAGSGIGEPGDSGSPALVDWGGNFALFGPHFGLGTGPPPFTISSYVGAYVNQINSIVGPSYSVIVVPEVSATNITALVGIAVLVLILRRRHNTIKKGVG